MRSALTTLALTLSLMGCGSEVPPPFPIAADVYYTGGESCAASTYLAGLLLIDRTTQPNRLVIQDDRGDKTSITWRGWGYRFRMAGDQVEVVDGWTVVATSGRRYAIGGRYEAAFHGFWACAGEVIPEPG
jgi:hypothetical protein